MSRKERWWGGPFMGGSYMRRGGFPLLMPMGGGFGMGMGGPSLLGDLAAGGLGYLLGRRTGQNTSMPQYQGYPSQSQYQSPVQYQANPSQPQYQAPFPDQYQTPLAYQAGAVPNQQASASGSNERLAQLKLLGHLRDSGTLTNDEFEAEKQKILQGF